MNKLSSCQSKHIEKLNLVHKTCVPSPFGDKVIKIIDRSFCQLRTIWVMMTYSPEDWTRYSPRKILRTICNANADNSESVIWFMICSFCWIICQFRQKHSMCSLAFLLGEEVKGIPDIIVWEVQISIFNVHTNLNSSFLLSICLCWKLL